MARKEKAIFGYNENTKLQWICLFASSRNANCTTDSFLKNKPRTMVESLPLVQSRYALNQFGFLHNNYKYFLDSLIINGNSKKSKNHYQTMKHLIFHWRFNICAVLALCTFTIIIVFNAEPDLPDYTPYNHN